MVRLKSLMICFVFPALSVLVVAYGYAQTAEPKNTLCNHQFALCTSAPCVPQPGDPTKAICTCDVEVGPSMSTVACDTIAPSTDKNGIRTVYSTFSVKQYQAGKKGLKCPGSTPWTWCLNKICTVDPTNPKKAICICDVMRTSEEWMTLGGNCDASTCATSYWSGATIADVESGGAFLTKALGLEESPLKWCADSQ